MPSIYQFPAPPPPSTKQNGDKLDQSDQAPGLRTYTRQRPSLESDHPPQSAMSHRQPLRAGPSSSSVTQDAHSPSSSSLSSAGVSPVKHTKRRSEIDRDGESEGDMDVEGVDEEDEEEKVTGKSEASGAEEDDEDGEDRFLDPGSSSITGEAAEVQRPRLIVEIRRTPIGPHNVRPLLDSRADPIIKGYIKQLTGQIAIGTELDLGEWGNETISRNFEKVYFSETLPPSENFNPQGVEIEIHFYRFSINIDLDEFKAVAEADDEEDAVPAASVRELPSRDLDGVMENLIFSTDLKARLLQYVLSTMTFSDAGVDFNKVSWNALVLLFGPPGTGKTSLCRGLAQRLLIRLSHFYDTGKLVEINSHSLFSKWFSESGKLVQKLFSHVTDLVTDERCLVIVMIDEVESLTAARSAAMNGSEPGDAVRVVNALLTQLDKLKAHPNVLVLTTSNIPDKIDSAFIDRADQKFFVDYPPPEAVFWILKGCLEELADRRMMRPTKITSVKEVKVVKRKFVGKDPRTLWKGKDREDAAGVKLWEIATKCYEENLAGRFLRRLPLLAHSHYLAPTCKKNADGKAIPRAIEAWLEAFTRVVEDEIEDRGRIAKKSHTSMIKQEGE